MVRPANAMRHPTFAEQHHRAAIAEVDYFRYSTMGLAVQRVIDDDIGGALAEVGVWRGEVSRFLHSLAPDRAIYLFDTFEGFPSPDLDPDRPVDTRFRDTSAAAVARRVGTDPNVRIRPGRVPETFAGLERESFAFVLIDLDLYGPTLASLRFFTPDCRRGTFAPIVHDYNNPESDWDKRALDTFTSEIPERPVELADIWGSVMLREPWPRQHQTFTTHSITRHRGPFVRSVLPCVRLDVAGRVPADGLVPNPARRPARAPVVRRRRRRFRRHGGGEDPSLQRAEGALQPAVQRGRPGRRPQRDVDGVAGLGPAEPVDRDPRSARLRDPRLPGRHLLRHPRRRRDRHQRRAPATRTRVRTSATSTASSGPHGSPRCCARSASSSASTPTTSC